MAAAGYSTGMFGKWDAGMATPDHTPLGRGYQSSLHYFHHANDYVSACDSFLSLILISLAFSTFIQRHQLIESIQFTAIVCSPTLLFKPHNMFLLI